jgi:hypothetical protein
MLSLLARLLLIYSVSGPAWATGLGERNMDLRKPASISDLVTNIRDLDCTPKCTGKAGCEAKKDMKSCLSGEPDKKSCFWSCE